MDSLQVTLTGPAADYVQEQVAAGSFRSPDEFVAAVVEADQRRRAIEEIERLLQVALDSGPPIEADEAFWERRRLWLEERIREIHQP